MDRIAYCCILLVALVSLVNTDDDNSTDYLAGLKPCTGTKGAPKIIGQTHVFGCSKVPCKLVKGENIHFIHKFHSVRNTPEIFNNFVAAFAFGLAPFKGFHLEPGCPNLKDDDFPGEPACPVKKHHNYTYEITFPLSKAFPSIDVISEIGMFEQDKKRPLTCFQIPLKLVTA